MIFNVAIREADNNTLFNHLIREDGQEDLCFALYNTGTSRDRTTGLITEIILPKPKERNVHGNVSFNHSYFDRVLQIALKKQMGIVFLHSHPSRGWQAMSKDDYDTEKMLAPRIKGATGLPLLGMTLGTDNSWSARFWNKVKARTYKRQWCQSVRVVGKHLSITFDDSQMPAPVFDKKFERTISAWGKNKQAKIARLKVGIVGIGSVGSQLAESLLRTGVQNILLIDFDKVEEKNLDRLHGIKKSDIGYLKSDVYSRQLDEYKLLANQEIESIPYSIVEEDGLNAALDCDVLLCCVDRPWARFVLNCISYAYMIPVIDGGIDASYSTKKDNIDQARWRTYTAAPERICMKCMGQYTPENVSLEQSGLLEDQNYVKGLSENHFSKRGENVYAFSMGLAGLQMQQFLSLILAPKGVYYGAKEMDFTTGNVDFQFPFSCDDSCESNNLVAAGDSIKGILIGKHEIAEESRKTALYYNQDIPTSKSWFTELLSKLNFWRQS